MQVAERLRGLGWSVRTQIGVSKYRIDLGVVHPDAPGRFLAGVECDGAAYHSAPSARDRDRVRHIVLEQLGWKLLRIWSTDFFLDEETSVARLDAKLRDLLEDDRKNAAEATAEAEAQAEAEPAVAEEADVAEAAAAAEAPRAGSVLAEAQAGSEPSGKLGLDKEEHGWDQPRDGAAPRAPADQAAWRTEAETVRTMPATPRPAPVPPVSQQVARAPRIEEGAGEPGLAQPDGTRSMSPPTCRG